MRPSEIEGWALKILDSLKRGEPLEDTRVELKAAFGNPVKIARRLAGHGNAARGDNLLWLFGVDETDGIVGVTAQEFSTWWSQVSKNFDPLAPSVVECIVSYEGKAILALLVYTDRAPFLVRNPSYGMQSCGPVELEVPWREMTSTRTARREDLLRLLVPLVKLPSVEVISASLVGQGEHKPGKGSYERVVPGKCEWNLDLELYFIPVNEEKLTFSAHKITIEVVQEEAFGSVQFKYYVDRPFGGEISFMTRVTTEDLAIKGPSRIHLKSHYEQNLLEVAPGARACVRVQLQPAGLERAVVLNCRLVLAKSWMYQLEEWSSSTI